MSTNEEDFCALTQAFFQSRGLSEKDLKSCFRAAVAAQYPTPGFSTLKNGAQIKDVETSTFGTGAVMGFVENGIHYVVLGQAGPHCEFEYRKNPKNTEPFPECFAIPGGYINLTETSGSTLVEKSDMPENGFIGAVREIEEEFPTDEVAADGKGVPLLAIDPDRLMPMDTLTFPKFGGRQTVMGFNLELTPDEIAIIKAHVARLESDAEYREKVALNTTNDESGLAEVSTVKIFKLDDVAEGRVPLYHQDQQSLFQKVQKYYQSREIIKARVGPTLEAQEKVMTLEQLKAKVEQWRATGNASIGITSGTFDFVHNGHTSLLNQASKECGRLIVIVASDRTTAEAKPGKPVNNEQDRAEFLAELGSVDAVIVSDEKYHETILKALEPDIMFKGDEYKGQEIHGAELVRQGVMFIECAEFVHKHSSAYLDHIWEKKPGDAPAP